jgi:leader peptidase (prepilin peptidase)/N-methyltransferase
MFTLIAVIIGLILGSFLSVLLERLPKGATGIVAGRSECPECHHQLGWLDLLPVVSFLILRARCRYCKTKIPWLYPALEVTSAAVLGLYAYRYGIGTSWLALDLLVLFSLVAMFFFDLKYRILPDVITLPLILIVSARLLFERPDLLGNMVATGVLLTCLFGLVHLVSHGQWLGLGDVKLAMLIGLLFGYPGAIGVTLVAVWSGALVGIILMILGRANMKTALPFGSFWALAAIITILWPGPIFYISGLFNPLIL